MAKTFTTTPFQLLQWKHAIRLEAQGLKVARKSVRAHVARLLGKSVRTPHADLIAILDGALAHCTTHGAGPTTRVEFAFAE